jgi:hypothetical protein
MAIRPPEGLQPTSVSRHERAVLSFRRAESPPFSRGGEVSLWGNPKNAAVAKRGRLLDTQIEAHVHGPVNLHDDAELLVADPGGAQMKSPSPNGEGESRPRCWKDQFLVQRRTAILPVQLP